MESNNNLPILYKNIFSIPLFFSNFQYINCDIEDNYNLLMDFLYSYGIDNELLYEDHSIKWCTIEVKEDMFLELLSNLGVTDKNLLNAPLYVEFATYPNNECLLVVTVINMDWVSNGEKVVRKKKSIKKLEIELNEAIKKEEYEKAAKIQKQITIKNKFKKEN